MLVRTIPCTVVDPFYDKQENIFSSDHHLDLN